MDRAMNDEAGRFRELYDANYDRVWRLLARIVGPQDADDLTQVVFVKAVKALSRFRGDAQISTWLYRIAANVASDWLRSRSTHEAEVTVQLPEVSDHDAGEADVRSASIDNCASPEQELIRKEMNDCIRGVIGQLPEGHRTVLMLGELGGFPDDEIARTLGISRGNAKVRLHRAREQLKQALAGRCDFYRNEDNEFACEPKPAAGCAPSRRPGCSSAKSDR
jgi:RNA polymerase sigma-70 factor (ECF subfamily)